MTKRRKRYENSRLSPEFLQKLDAMDDEDAITPYTPLKKTTTRNEELFSDDVYEEEKEKKSEDEGGAVVVIVTILVIIILIAAIAFGMHKFLM